MFFSPAKLHLSGYSSHSFFLPSQWNGSFLLYESQLRSDGARNVFEPFSGQTCLEVHRVEIKSVVGLRPLHLGFY